MRIQLLALFLVIASLSCAQTSIIPAPAHLAYANDEKPFLLNTSTLVVTETKATEKTARFLVNYLSHYYQLKLKTVDQTAKYNTIRLRIGSLPAGSNGAYELDVTEKVVVITGSSEQGLFYGMQTFLQLIAPDKSDRRIPALHIDDAPRFVYRGMHLDVSRHFFPVAIVKKYIDFLALHKLNVFHWHLTDDQGWRIEIKKYPRLTSVGGWRNGTIIGRYPGTGNDGKKYGGFYTQAEIREVVRYAQERYIDVIPEIEMPGHASAAIAAYPQLSCFPAEPTISYFPKACTWSGTTEGKQVQQTWGVFDDVFCAGRDSTFTFLQDVLEEVLPLFPSKYIHVGGDECPKTNWKKCAACQARIASLGLKDEHGLQSYFIQRIEKFLNAKNRTLIGWDEILEGGLAPNAVVMSWQGEKGGIEAAKQHHDVIMTPGNPVYFDHTQSEQEDSVTIGGFNPIEKVYAYDPVPKELQADQEKYIMGVQANLWTEYIAYPSKIEYMVFPRMAALSEIAWSGREKKDWNNFEKRLAVQFERYDLWKANYSKAYFDLKTSIRPVATGNGVQWVIKPRAVRDVYFRISYPVIAKTTDTLTLYDEKDPRKKTGQRIVLPGDTIVAQRVSNHPGIDSIPITLPGTYTASAYYSRIDFEQSSRQEQPFAVTRQVFQFSKTTGKEIRLINPISDRYPGDGPFTLVNGVINEKGYARTTEFAGFNGTDCDAIVDLGESQSISEFIVHALNRPTSWIWAPSNVEILVSVDGENWNKIGETSLEEPAPSGNGKVLFHVKCPPTTLRYINYKIRNKGVIPTGNAGAGNKAWLFVDELSAH